MCTHMILSECLKINFFLKNSHVICSTLREVVLIPNRHWGGEGLLGCVFGSVPLLDIQAFPILKNSIVSFGLLHRIPPQPEDRVPGTVPAELEEQAEEEYEDQDLFVPADTELQEVHHSPSQIAEWRRREQEQWNHEVQTRSAASGHHLSTADTLSMTTDELAQRFVPGTSNHATPTRSRIPLDLASKWASSP